MKTGDIVYLCENYFSEFRTVHDFIKSECNCYFKNVKSKNKLIQNRFYVLAVHKSFAMISMSDSEIDYDFYSNVISEEIRKIRLERKLISHENTTQEYYISQILSIVKLSSQDSIVYTCVPALITPMRNYIFTVSIDKLSKIEGL